MKKHLTFTILVLTAVVGLIPVTATAQKGRLGKGLVKIFTPVASGAKGGVPRRLSRAGTNTPTKPSNMTLNSGSNKLFKPSNSTVPTAKRVNAKSSSAGRKVMPKDPNYIKKSTAKKLAAKAQAKTKTNVVSKKRGGKEHTSNRTPSNKEKHQKGRARNRKDGWQERGDKRRPYRRK